MIKHISFDLWGTLITGNPKFSQTRIEILAKLSGKQQEEVRTVIKEVSTDHNTQMVTTGQHLIGSDGLYSRVFRKLGIEASEDDMEDFIDLMGRNFNLNEPSFIYPNTLEIMDTLKEKGITMSILSNTGFIESSLLRPFLVKHGISQYMYYNNTYGGMYFSDELTRAKPNPALFSFVAIMHGVKNDEMLHVGDDFVADGGARAIGCEALIIGEAGVANLTHLLNTVNLLTKQRL
jgi:putative hydrolase of the HAD superfamily